MCHVRCGCHGSVCECFGCSVSLYLERWAWAATARGGLRDMPTHRSIRSTKPAWLGVLQGGWVSGGGPQPARYTVMVLNTFVLSQHALRKKQDIGTRRRHRGRMARSQWSANATVTANGKHNKRRTPEGSPPHQGSLFGSSCGGPPPGASSRGGASRGGSASAGPSRAGSSGRGPSRGSSISASVNA